VTGKTSILSNNISSPRNLQLSAGKLKTFQLNLGREKEWQREREKKSCHIQCEENDTDLAILGTWIVSRRKPHFLRLATA